MTVGAWRAVDEQQQRATLFSPDDEEQWLEESDDAIDDYEFHEGNDYLTAYENQFDDGGSQHFTVGSRWAFATQVLSAYAVVTERAAALSANRKPVDPADYKDKFLWKNDEVVNS